MLPHLHFIQKGRKDGTEEEGIFVAEVRARTVIEGTQRVLKQDVLEDLKRELECTFFRAHS